MNLTCDKCGANNTLPAGENSVNCDYCGTSLSESKVEIINRSSNPRASSDKVIIMDYLRNGSKGKLVLPMAELKGIDLEGADLEGADLEGADLEDALLSKANLKNANLRKARLMGADLTGADLSKSDCTSIKGCGVDPSKAITNTGSDSILQRTLNRIKNDRFAIKGATFIGADLTDTNLRNADLRMADFTKACLNRAMLVDALLEKAKLTDADLIETDFSKSNLLEATLSKVTAEQLNSMSEIDDIELIGTDIPSVNFSHLKISKIRFEGCNLPYAVFNNMDINIHCRNSSFRGSLFGNSDVYFYGIENSDFSDVDFSKSKQVTISEINNVKLNSSNCRNVRFSAFTIEDVDFTGSDLRGAKFEEYVNFINSSLSKAKSGGNTILFKKRLKKIFGG